MAAVLAAILHGVANGLEPTLEASGAVSEVQGEFAAGLLDALARLERSAALERYIPRRYLEAYAQVKRGEYQDLFGEILPVELDFYL
jgi:glutamine synthetase